AAGQLVGRCDAVSVLDAFHDFEDTQVEIVLSPDSAQNRVDHAGGAVDVEAQFHQAIDHTLNLLLAGAFLHYDNHWCSASSLTIRKRWMVRISSIMRSKMRRTAASVNGPWLDTVMLANTCSSRR